MIGREGRGSAGVADQPVTGAGAPGDERARRRIADLRLYRALMRIEARRQAERRQRVQERIDEEGCGAVMVLVRMAREDWL